MNPVKIKIAVSSCLLGNAVRYDGLDKRNDNLIDTLGDEFELVAVCPEVLAGLGVPRPAVQLVNVENELKALGVNDNTLDVSVHILKVAKDFVETNNDICGLILKSKSPSCGLESTQVFDQDNILMGYGSGLFANYVIKHKSRLPTIEDTAFSDPDILIAFSQQVREYSVQNL